MQLNRSLTIFGLLGLLGTGSMPQPTKQSWEKTLAQGFMYRMEVDLEAPRTVHAVRISPKAEGVRAIPALPGKNVFDSTSTVGRGTMTRMAIEYDAFGAINADFFPFSADRSTGDPLGFMCSAGELISSPGRTRAVFAWGDEASATGNVAFTGSIKVPGGTPIRINGVNEETGLNQVVLSSPMGGVALVRAPSTSVVLKTTTPKLPLDGEITATVESISADIASIPVGPDRLVLTAQGTAAPNLSALKPGTAVTISIKCTGFDWSKTPNAIGGGPNLLLKGETKITATEEGFGEAFSTTRHPRTAVGRTKDGDVWWVVVDGRSKHSVGASLAELAAIMKRLECVDAVNLDGGGSSSLTLGGSPVNRPSGGTERAVANGVVFQIPKSTGPAVKTVRLVKTAAGVQAVASDASGKTIPNAFVLWSASAGGWIDQTGMLRPIAGGTIKVSAWAGGQRADASIELQPAGN